MTPLLSSTLLRTQSDSRLLLLASQGHERAFEAIVERYRKPLHRWCRRVLPEARAEDAVQTTFLKAWSALEAGTEVAELKPWLYRIARNSALDNARKAGYDYDELSDALQLTPAPESDLERRSVIRNTLTGIAELPGNQREALLRTAAGHSRAEIARELQVSEGAVRQLVHRARTTLRAAATAVTPLPLASWASALGSDAGAPAAQRIAELATGAGSAGLAATAVKAGTVIVAAGVLAAGPGADLRHEISSSSAASAASSKPGDRTSHAGTGGDGTSSAEPGNGAGSGSGQYAGGGLFRHGGGPSDSSGSSRHGVSGSSGGGSDEHGGSSRSGSSASGSDGSGSSGRSGDGGGDGGGDHSGSGSGSGTSGSGTSGSSGSGSSGSGGGGDSTPSGSGDGGSGSSGPGPSGSTMSGSGVSGSGSSGSGSSGSGSSGHGGGDDPVRTLTSPLPG